MKDEIKEILDELEKVKDSVGAFIGTDNKGAQILLDYITNLQTIEREYSAILSENAELEQKYDMALEDNVRESHRRMELQKENESLHTRIKTIKRRRKEQTAKIRKYREEITNKQNSNKDYKTRNEKAVELLQNLLPICIMPNNTLIHGTEKAKAIEKAINILQGKSDE